MKAELELIWKDRKCRMPLNLVWWRLGSNSFGYRETDKIWYSKGKRNRIKNVLRRPKSYLYRR